MHIQVSITSSNSVEDRFEEGKTRKKQLEMYTITQVKGDGTSCETYQQRWREADR